MEEAVLAQLEQHPELLKPFFQYNSSNDHRLIWAFYHLIAEQQTEILSQPETLRHLIALTLNRGSELPSEVQDFENLLQFLAVYPCSEQTKWLCSQLWRQPEVYFERYQQLLALCTPVLQAHEAALQAEFDAAAAQTRAALAGEPTDFMQQFGMQHLALDQMVVCPSAAFFNGIGLSPATISHHMSSLVSAGFIHVDKQNPRGFNLEAARVLLWRKKSRKQVTGLSAGDSLSI